MKKRKGKWLRGNVSVFGKTVPIFVLAIALSAAIGFALLTTYVTVTGNATVDQSVVLDDSDAEFSGGCHLTWDEESSDQCDETSETAAEWATSAFGGDTRAVGIRLVNRGESEAPVEFALDATIPPEDGAVWDDDVGAELFDDYDPAEEVCTGSSLGTFESEDSSVSGGTLDPGESKWYCINLEWDIAAVPGAYSFDVSINPA